ncbi:MAG: aminoacyl-histidine dipeptidase [Melioribacteraceae bacterium]
MMANKLAELKPQLVWKHFENLCNIPRPSRHEEKAAEYVLKIAKDKKLQTKVDSFGNIVVIKPASKGKEKLTPVVLQGHLDIVPEKNSDVKHDFLKDPVDYYVDGDWVKARGTTLGADNGIGIASALAILESDDLNLGPIEALFTLDEETGLNGAQALKPGFLESKILFNLDSEDEALYIGCAGGQNTYATYKPKMDAAPANTTALAITIKGLRGGHSGLDINSGRGNSIKIIVRLLLELSDKFNMRLVSVNGGSKHNAIPRESFAVIRVPNKNVEAVQEAISNFESVVKNEISFVEEGFLVEVKKSSSKAKVMDKKTTNNMLKGLYTVPNGVQKMSMEIDGLVQTSTNLAVLETKPKGVFVTTSQRSSIESEKKDTTAMVSIVFQLTGAEITHGDSYPGWQPDLKSTGLKVLKSEFKKKYKKEPEIKAIHAGLECGIIKERYPDMDMISFGPTIMNPHSPDEKVQISTVNKFWDLLVNSLKNVPSI